jgi:hypothetical protein
MANWLTKKQIALEEVEAHENGHCSWRTISRL